MHLWEEDEGGGEEKKQGGDDGEADPPSSHPPGVLLVEVNLGRAVKHKTRINKLCPALQRGCKKWNVRIDTERTTCYRKARKNNDGDDDDEDGDDLHPGVDIGSQTSAPEKEAQSGSHQSRRKRQTKG